MTNIYSLDVVFCENEDGVRIPLPEEYKKSDEIIRKPTDNQLKWNVVVLGMKNKYQSDSQQPIAAFSQRLNLLRKLGYHVIEVCFLFSYRISHFIFSYPSKGLDDGFFFIID